MLGSAGTWKLHKIMKKKNCRGWRIGFRICLWFVPFPLQNPRKFPPKSYQRHSGTANPPKANRNNRNGKRKMALSETWAPTSWSSMFIHENHPFSPEPRAQSPKKRRSDQQHSRCTTWWPSVLTSQLCPGHPFSNCCWLQHVLSHWYTNIAIAYGQYWPVRVDLPMKTGDVP